MDAKRKLSSISSIEAPAPPAKKVKTRKYNPDGYNPEGYYSDEEILVLNSPCPSPKRARDEDEKPAPRKRARFASPAVEEDTPAPKKMNKRARETDDEEGSRKKVKKMTDDELEDLETELADALSDNGELSENDELFENEAFFDKAAHADNEAPSSDEDEPAPPPPKQSADAKRPWGGRAAPAPAPAPALAPASPLSDTDSWRAPPSPLGSEGLYTPPPSPSAPFDPEDPRNFYNPSGKDDEILSKPLESFISLLDTIDRAVEKRSRMWDIPGKEVPASATMHCINGDIKIMPKQSLLEPYSAYCKQCDSWGRCETGKCFHRRWNVALQGSCPLCSVEGELTYTGYMWAARPLYGDDVEPWKPADLHIGGQRKCHFR